MIVAGIAFARPTDEELSASGAERELLRSTSAVRVKCRPHEQVTPLNAGRTDGPWIYIGADQWDYDCRLTHRSGPGYEISVRVAEHSIVDRTAP